MTESQLTFYNFYDEENDIKIVYEKGHEDKARELYNKLLAENKRNIKMFVESLNINVYKEHTFFEDEKA